MAFTGSRMVPNRFGGESMEHSFENEQHQAVVRTNSRLTEGSEFDKFVSQLAGRVLDMHEDYEPQDYIGREYIVTVEQVNGLDRATGFKPVDEGTAS